MQEANELARAESATVVDLSASVAAAAAAAAVEQGFLDLLFRVGPVALGILDADLRFLRLNEHLADINGVAVTEHLGRRISEILPAAGAELESQQRGALEHGHPIVGIHVREPVGPGLEPRRFRYGCYPLWAGDDRSGPPLAVAVVMDELTSQIAAQDTAARIVEQAVTAAGITATLSEGRLDVAGAAGLIAERIALAFGDTCVVCLRPGVEARPVAAKGGVAGARAVLEQLLAYRLPDGSDLVDLAVEMHRPVVLQNPEKGSGPSDMTLDLIEPVRGSGLSTVLIAPMRAIGEVVGALALGRDGGHPYRDADLHFVQDLADRAGLVLANARLYAEAQASAVQLGRLLRVTEAVVGVDSVDELVGRVLPVVQDVLDADHARLLLAAADGRSFEVAGGAERSPPMPLGAGAAEAIVADPTPVVVDDLAVDPDSHPLLVAPDVVSAVGIPLVAHGELVGVLQVGSRQPRHFTTSEVDLLDRVADRIAVVVRQVRIESALGEVSKLSETVLATAADAILTVDEMGIVQSANPAASRLFGYEEVELVGQSISLLTPEPYRSEHDGYLRHYRETGERRIIGIGREVEGIRRDGTTVPLDLMVSEVMLPDGRRLFTGIARDITERREAADQLRYQALHDSLTGLPNRSLFFNDLDQALARRARSGATVTVFFIDVDRFKQINDKLGHAAGDQLLVEVAARLRRSVRPSDTVARLGGDEFAVLLEDVGPPRDAVSVAGRINDEFHQPIDLEGETATVSVSVGIARTTDDPESAVDLLRNADAALYRAKERGRDRFEMYDDRVRDWLRQRLRIENDLHFALLEGRVGAAYQPVVALADGRLAALEVTGRIQGEPPGPPGTDDLLIRSVAEESGLIVSVATRMLEQAARDARDWTAAGLTAPELWIDVSTRQLDTRQFAELLDSTPLLAGGLWLEVSEASLLEDPQLALDRLAALAGRGVHLALDNFGEGVSSLTHLTRFPFSAVKICPSLVGRTPTDAAARALIAGLVTVAHGLGMLVVAEGATESGSLATLAELGVDRASGPAVGPLVGPTKAAEVLRRRNLA